MTHAIVLAGGMATRLQPITTEIPKCMVSCGGRPFIDYQLVWMASHGVGRVTMVLGHLSEQVIEHLRSIKIKGLEIDWVVENQGRLGTGGAVNLALNSVPFGDDFLIVYGDSFMPVDFGEIARHARAVNALALMTVLHNRGSFDTSNCHFDGDLIPLYSKDRETQIKQNFQYVDYGISYWKRNAFTASAPQKPVWDLAEIIGKMSQQGQLKGLEVKTRFYEIGSPESLTEFRDLVEGKIDRSLSDVINSTITTYMRTL
jgi:MurNAc alpha-1-phosphate uridylyltransferase